MTREEWLKNRLKGIGGSDAAAILGLNPWKTNLDLWKIKTGRATEEDISHKANVKYGIEAEPFLRELFKLDYPQYEVTYEEYNSHVNPDYPFIMGSFDGDILERETGRKGVYEGKTSEIKSQFMNKQWEGQIPQYYYCQALHYFICDPEVQFVKVKAQLKSQRDGEVYCETKHYHFERKDYLQDIETLKQAEIKFWTEYVQKDIEPGEILPAI